MVVPVFWSILLLGLFLVTFFISVIKGEISSFFNSIKNSSFIWVYLSGPLSLILGVLLCVGFVVFPISYIDVEDKYVRIHRAFKKDSFIKYDEIFYIRFNKIHKYEWAFVFILAIGMCEINTIEIHKDYPYPRLWLSASHRAYNAIAKKLKEVLSNKNTLVEGNCFIAESQWVDKHGSPQNVEWDGYH